MREARRGTQTAHELGKTLNIFGLEVHELDAFSRSFQIIQRGSQRCLLVNEIRLEVHEAEKRLQLANCGWERPLC